ncbi:MAG: leucine--tRNA ligase [Nanoarchaeota archaeon]|jgi:leucyl-tRNA synthetase|nr:leucine--tRNA ligase [Nanoarchaeota archaeon]
MVEIDFKAIEKKWQNKWAEASAFVANDDSDKPKYYVLEMFPYPSGSGLHMGHAWNYTIGDIIARFKMMSGFEVLHPMGYDSLGLPAENAAIQAGKHPDEYTNESIPNFVKQQKAIGLTYDWSRMISSHDATYYKWDQWIFLKMLEKGLAYQKKSAVNWCPKCDTVLANEQVTDGKCWRHDDTAVIVKHLTQWFLKITDYADELYENLDNMDWPARTKAMQKHWIGKSHGTEIDFEINGEKWPVFTTRADTIFGVTFVVVAAAHSKLDALVTEGQRGAVDEFLKTLKSVSEKEMGDMEKEGVFTGSYAINPANGEKVPVYAGNFVVADYGSGMVMAVPAHDQRDLEFAKKYGIKVKRVIRPKKARYCIIEKSLPENKISELEKFGEMEVEKVDEDWGKFIIIYPTPEKEKELIAFLKNNLLEKSENVIGWYANSSDVVVFKDKEFSISTTNGLSEFKEYGRSIGMPEAHLDLNVDCYSEKGILSNSGEFNGLESKDAIEKIADWLKSKGSGRKVTNFRLRDWGISRQRYWGTPIPIIHCKDCGAVPVPEKDLPVVLPKDVKFGEGNPLETNEEWLNVSCPKCGSMGRREADTMDTFVNSSWYFLRYCDPKNNNEIFDKDKVRKWCPVDTYVGGAEHACMHLIYSRFYVKFLRDLGYLDFDEPAKRLFHQGMLSGEGGVKMSKSKPETCILPKDVSNKYGMDTARFFLSSLASPDKDIDWSEKGIIGSLRFVNKIFEFAETFEEKEDSSELEIKLNNVIKNVSEYYDNFQYRKATIELRALFDLMEKGCSKDTYEKFLKLLNPICPHITEEFWEKLGNDGLISKSLWPKFDSIKLKVAKKEIDVNEKVIGMLKPNLEKVECSKIYLYVIPMELEKYDVARLVLELGKEVIVYSVRNGDKYDPKNKAKKSRPGMPSFYLE